MSTMSTICIYIGGARCDFASEPMFSASLWFIDAELELWLLWIHLPHANPRRSDKNIYTLFYYHKRPNLEW